METKTCCKCNENKAYTEFSKKDRSKDGLNKKCKKCINERTRIWYETKYKPSGRKNYVRTRYRAFKKKCRENQEYYQFYIETKKRRRFEKNVHFKLKNIFSNRIRYAFKSQHLVKSNITERLLGCKIPEAKKYIESKFTKGMSWENHGLYGWHIDHIIPCDSFDLTKEEEQLKCFHYTNLQPLWATTEIARKNGDLNGIGNLDKGNRIFKLNECSTRQ